MIEHILAARRSDLPAPEKPVLTALANSAGHLATLNIKGIAGDTGYDETTVERAVESLLAQGVIYLVEHPVPAANAVRHVQFKGVSDVV